MLSHFHKASRRSDHRRFLARAMERSMTGGTAYTAKATRTRAARKTAA